MKVVIMGGGVIGVTTAYDVARSGAPDEHREALRLEGCERPRERIPAASSKIDGAEG